MPADHDFDVALSFSGDHRTYVATVAAGLKRRGFRVFYDQYLRPQLVGRELLSFLQDVYGHRSAIVAAFISEQWVTRAWPTHERETALAHALLIVSREAQFLFHSDLTTLLFQVSNQQSATRTCAYCSPTNAGGDTTPGTSIRYMQ